jgi:hypothetical protein
MSSAREGMEKSPRIKRFGGIRRELGQPRERPVYVLRGEGKLDVQAISYILMYHVSMIVPTSSINAFQPSR